MVSECDAFEFMGEEQLDNLTVCNVLGVAATLSMNMKTEILEHCIFLSCLEMDGKATILILSLECQKPQ